MSEFATVYAIVDEPTDGQSRIRLRSRDYEPANADTVVREDAFYKEDLDLIAGTAGFLRASCKDSTKLFRVAVLRVLRGGKC